MSDYVRPKKHLGQHFLTDIRIAQKIVDALSVSPTATVVEIGPGKGVLTAHLEPRYTDLKLLEIDKEAVVYLRKCFPRVAEDLVPTDCLHADWDALSSGTFHVIGNFPYNISSQIFFKILAHLHRVETVVCMLQKEVADRISEPPGSKVYGILSVLLQAHYEIKKLFAVPPGAFFPRPKVHSTVISLQRKENYVLPCNEQRFRQVVKQAFQMRRKTLRNSLKGLNLSPEVTALDIMGKRPEQLSVACFVALTQQVINAEQNKIGK